MTQAWILFADSAPIAVLSIVYQGRLSRLLTWNTETDKFSQSTWLKARLETWDLSSDGEYLTYFVEAFHRLPNSYMAVSRPPFLKALLFWPVHHHFDRGAWFGPDGALHIIGWPVASYKASKDSWEEPRIVPGCPFQIKKHTSPLDPKTDRYPVQKRQGYAEALRRYGPTLVHDSAMRKPRQIVEAFPKAIQLIESHKLDMFAWDNHGEPILWSGEGVFCRVSKQCPQGRIVADIRDRTFEERVPPNWANSWTAPRKESRPKHTPPK